LEPELLAAVMTDAGRPCTAEQMRAEVARLATERREEVLRVLITRALDAEVQPTGRQMPADPVVRIRAQLQRDKELAEQKQQHLEQVATQQAEALTAVWEDDWLSLVHGKSVLGEVARSRLSPFGDLPSLVDAVAAYCQRLPADLPNDLQRLQTMLQKSPRRPAGPAGSDDDLPDRQVGRGGQQPAAGQT
jgi:hypothetical protein